MLDYICSQRIKHGKMPADPVMIKTIVTMDMGEQIGKLEQLGKADSYVFGFEESYGYLTGSYVRDKDGVDGAYMIVRCSVTMPPRASACWTGWMNCIRHMVTA